jgi:hypothetical protein
LEHVERKDFIHSLAYLADIFNLMNEINLWIQGCYWKITSFLG